MCCGGSGEQPEAPALPAPVNMGPVYAIQAESGRNQNEIARGQLGIAERQEEIATERNQRGIEEYRPIEKDILASTNRGIDPASYEARARNAIAQDVSPALRVRGRALAQRGVDAGSPRQEAERLNIGAKAARSIGDTTYKERKRIESLNDARKGQAYSLGANIPQEVVQGYGSASGMMAGAGQQMAGAANNLSSIYTAKANADYQGRLTNYNVAYNQYKNDLAEWNASQGSGLFSTIGGVAGGILGSYGGPVGTAVGATIGSGLGSYLDQAFY